VRWWRNTGGTGAWQGASTPKCPLRFANALPPGRGLSFAFSASSYQALRADAWPVNVRELDHRVAIVHEFAMAVRLLEGDAMANARRGRLRFNQPGLRARRTTSRMKLNESWKEYPSSCHRS
jgi:hypothetical protein